MTIWGHYQRTLYRITFLSNPLKWKPAVKYYVHFAFLATSVYEGFKGDESDPEFHSFEEAKAAAIVDLRAHIQKGTANLHRLEKAKSVSEYEDAD